MKSLPQYVLLACLLSLFVFSDWAMAQPWRNRNAMAQSQDIDDKGVKLGVDTPFDILEEAMVDGYSDEGEPAAAHAAMFYYAQC